MEVRIIGQRCTLRDWTVEDLPLWARWMAPGHRWHQLDGPYYPGLTDAAIEQEVARREAVIHAAAVENPRRSLVIADPDDDRLLGTVTWSWESIETHWPLVGIVIFDETRWGTGIGTDALRMWCDYLFDALPQIVRLDLRTWSGNIGMCRLAERLGFTLEARFRDARIVDGVYHDGLGYGILRREWEMLRAAVGNAGD